MGNLLSSLLEDLKAHAGARRLGQDSEQRERPRVCARPRPWPGRVRRNAQKSRDELPPTRAPASLPVAARREHPSQLSQCV